MSTVQCEGVPVSYSLKSRREFVTTKTFLQPEAIRLVLLGISAGVRWLSAWGGVIIIYILQDARLTFYLPL